HVVGTAADAADNARVVHDGRAAADLELVRRRKVGELAGGLRGREDHHVCRLRAVHGRDSRGSGRLERRAVGGRVRRGDGCGTGGDRRRLVAAAEGQSDGTYAHQDPHEREQMRQRQMYMHGEHLVFSSFGITRERTAGPPASSVQKKRAAEKYLPPVSVDADESITEGTRGARSV